MKPSPEEQLKFLNHIQRLFQDGDFVATYKFALLMALAEVAVESGDTDGELPLTMILIAEKFAELYWPQTAPYTSGVAGTVSSVLSQNQGSQAAVVNALIGLRRSGASTIAQAKQSPGWLGVMKRISSIVSNMPVKHLQSVGGSLVPFLYAYPHPRGAIVLKAGVAVMLRTFYPLIQQLSRSGWVRHVRENRLNASVIGQADQLEPFMFGSPRNALAAAVPVLAKIQSGACFYCSERISSAAEVDHFIPWSRYPRDLAHNFVLALAKCNGAKSDMLAAERHLDHWRKRNDRFKDDIASEMPGFVADSGCSVKVAHWAYEQGISIGAHGWIKGKDTETLGIGCLERLV